MEGDVGVLPGPSVRLLMGESHGLYIDMRELKYHLEQKFRLDWTNENRRMKPEARDISDLLKL